MTRNTSSFLSPVENVFTPVCDLFARVSLCICEIYSIYLLFYVLIFNPTKYENVFTLYKASVQRMI